MNLAQWQNAQPPVRGKDSLGNVIDDGSASRSFRRVEFMSGTTAIGLISKLEDAGMEPALSIDPDFTMDSGEIRKRYLYTIPEGTFPLGAVFALTFGKTGKLYKLDAPDSSGSWIGFKEDAPAPAPAPVVPVQQPAPTGYHWVQGLMGLSLAKDSTLGLTDAQKTEVLNRVAKALE